MSRQVYLMRGVPGSGKSTWAEALQRHDRQVLILSADSYHLKDGLYQFDPLKVRQAHDACLTAFLDDLERNERRTAAPLVVDNTNLALWEIAPYYRLAECLGFPVEIIELATPLHVCLGRQLHGVPAEKLGMMQAIMDFHTPLLPRWWKRRVITNTQEAP